MIHEPLHPGLILKDALIDHTELTITEAAERLNVTRTTLSRLLNAHTCISPEMALRLAQFFNTSVESWINLQAQYDAWLVQKNATHIHISPYLNTICKQQETDFSYF